MTLGSCAAWIRLPGPLTGPNRQIFSGGVWASQPSFRFSPFVESSHLSSCTRRLRRNQRAATKTTSLCVVHTCGPRGVRIFTIHPRGALAAFSCCTKEPLQQRRSPSDRSPASRQQPGWDRMERLLFEPQGPRTRYPTNLKLVCNSAKLNPLHC